MKPCARPFRGGRFFMHGPAARLSRPGRGSQGARRKGASRAAGHEKGPRCAAGRERHGCRGTISRVMSWVIICLDLPLPAGSSNQPVTGRAARCHVSVLLRMGFTCARPVTVPAVVSYTALPPLPMPSLAAWHIRRYSHSASLHVRTWLRHILSETQFTILMQASARDCVSDTAGLGIGGIFLLHCPGSRLRRPLTGIPSPEARTFLETKKSRDHISYSRYIWKDFNT